MSEIGVTVRAIKKYASITQNNGNFQKLGDLEKDITELYRQSTLFIEKAAFPYTITPFNLYLVYKANYDMGTSYLYLIVQNKKIIDVIRHFETS